MAQFIVQSKAGADAWFLRGTVWAGSRDRATVFASREAAQAALLSAKRFMRPAAFKLCVIYELPNDDATLPAAERAAEHDGGEDYEILARRSNRRDDR